MGLLSPTAPTTLATLQEGVQFGTGSGYGDHLTLGARTPTTRSTLLNPIDLNATSGSAALQRFASIRGTGTLPEGQFSGAISNTGGSTIGVNMNFDGNGGLIFASSASSYLAQTLQLNGGAVFLSTGDPAAAGQNGPLGIGRRHPPDRRQCHDLRGQPGLHDLRTECGRRPRADDRRQPGHRRRLCGRELRDARCWADSPTTTRPSRARSP